MDDVIARVKALAPRFFSETVTGSAMVKEVRNV